MKQRGIVATTMKGAFKIYLVPATRARNALATLTASWSDFVAEAREEREASKRTDDLSKPDAEPAVAADAFTAPSAEPSEQWRSAPRTPITPGAERKPRATGAERHNVAARREGVIEKSPPMPAPEVSEAPEAPPSPTLIETGESSVEVRPNPAISPPHVTSGVIAHLPPEVHHKLAGNGPIRA